MTATTAPDLDLLKSARVHEATGSGRRTFALAVAAQLEGTVMWLQDVSDANLLHPPGIAAFVEPARVLLATPSGTKSILQVMEEVLRSGVIPLVIAELREAPDLTESRRLQLSAGTGGGRGLCLIPERKLRSNAAESRWRCSPLPGGGGARQHWEIVKNKKGRLGQWRVAWDADAGRYGEEVRETEGV